MAFLMPSGAGVEKMTICGTGIQPVLPPRCHSVHQELHVSPSVLEATLERTIYSASCRCEAGGCFLCASTTLHSSSTHPSDGILGVTALFSLMMEMNIGSCDYLEFVLKIIVITLNNNRKTLLTKTKNISLLSMKATILNFSFDK